MPEHDIRSLSRRWFEEVWNQGREATIDELLLPQTVIHGAGEGGRDLQGPDGFREFYRPFRSAFPDIRVVVEDMLADGDQTAVRLSFTGTHTGPGLRVPPTGRAFRSTALVVIRWRDGRAVEGWNEFDAAGMMAQLQPAAPAPPGAAMKLKA
jgi:steroid delta-isomerase-like uncharacterized protein